MDESIHDAIVGTVSAWPGVAAGRAEPHHIYPESRWVSVPISNETDVPSRAGAVPHELRTALGASLIARGSSS